MIWDMADTSQKKSLNPELRRSYRIVESGKSKAKAGSRVSITIMMVVIVVAAVVAFVVDHKCCEY
jgi:hypothetical protein